jgi:hypothetical protein
VAWTATGQPCSSATRSAAATWPPVRGRTTRAGGTSRVRFHPRQSSSVCGTKAATGSGSAASAASVLSRSARRYPGPGSTTCHGATPGPVRDATKSVVVEATVRPATWTSAVPLPRYVSPSITASTAMCTWTGCSRSKRVSTSVYENPSARDVHAPWPSLAGVRRATVPSPANDRRNASSRPSCGATPFQVPTGVFSIGSIGGSPCLAGAAGTSRPAGAWEAANDQGNACTLVMVRPALDGPRELPSAA